MGRFFSDKVSSMNHHFWGDISAWFIKGIVGIIVNPEHDNPCHVDVSPLFINALDFADGYHITNCGEIKVRWERCDCMITVMVDIPENIKGKVILRNGYFFENGESIEELKKGTYMVVSERIDRSSN